MADSRQKKWVISEDEGRPVRMWSASEFESREFGLLEVARALEELRVPYFLADGTLLGAAREGDFIPWDSDVGIWIKAEVYGACKDKLVTYFSRRNFRVEDVGGRNPKLNLHKNSEKFELESWRLRGKFRVRSGYRVPGHLLDSPGQIMLRGRNYPCPSPVEEFLVQRYGTDWKIPRVLSDSHPSSKTRWALSKAYIRRLSPPWLLDILGKG